MSLKNSVFNELREQQQLCDVVLRVGHREFHAHKIILCNCGHYFRALFTRWSSPDRRVFDVSDVSPQIMELIIDYAYTDSLPVTETTVEDLFIAADRFDVTGIIQVCVDLLEKLLSPLNCVRIGRFADEHFQPELKYKAFLFMLSHFEEVVATSDEFRDLSVTELVKIMESDRLNVREERTAYEAVLHWIDFAPEERQTHLSLLLSKVRLAQISEVYIRHCIFENPMVKNDDMCRKILDHTLKVIRMLKKKPSSNILSRNPVASPRLPLAVMLAFGGGTDSALEVAVIQAYDFRADRWVNVTSDNGAPRSLHGSVFLNGFVYCVGGSVDMRTLSSVHRFYLDTHTWQEVAPMHSRRSSVAVTVLDGRIYAVGGFDGRSHLATAEVYLPGTNQWTEIAPMHEERTGADCVALNGKVYVFGGLTDWHALSSAECYDPDANQWTMIANMESARPGFRVVAYANRIFAVGGHTALLSLNSMESYDPDSNTWHSEAPMQNSRSCFGISVMDGRIFVVGGISPWGLQSNVECYDAGTARWSNVCDLDFPRYGLSCCVVHGLDNMRDYTFPRYSPS